MTAAVTSFAEEAEAYLAKHPATETVEVLFSDVSGIFRGKQYPTKDLASLARKGMTSPASHLMLDASGHTEHPRLGPGFEGDPDVLYRPVPGSLRPVPWRSAPTAQLLSEAWTLDGAPHACDPRALLRKALAPITALGLTPVVAIELEFYLFDAGAGAPVPAAPSSGIARLEGTQCMSMDVLDDYLDFVTEVKETCRIQGIPLSSILTEFGDGQFEGNLVHVPDALQACDDAMNLKRAVKAVARKRNAVASFMAKPFAENSGSGLHVHMSLLDKAGRNVFGGPTGESTLKQAIGGLLQLMPECMLLFCPNANSYRRLREGSFVPLEPCWSANERGVAIRLPVAGEKDARFEHRVAGADACPYLVVAAILAGVHHGLANGLDPGPPTREVDAKRPAPLPKRWPLGIRALEQATVIPEYLGPAFIEAYLRMKRFEEERYHAAIPIEDFTWYLRTV